MIKESDYIFPKEIRENPLLDKWDDEIPMVELFKNPDFFNDFMESCGMSKKERKHMWKSIGRRDLADEIN